MNRIICSLLLVCTLWQPAARAETKVATPVPYTTIHVHNMHCDACAKQIARKLYAVPGVVEVRADVTNNVAYAVPQKDKTLSPRSLWTAVESAGFQVARLESPHGTFTAKPTR